MMHQHAAGNLYEQQLDHSPLKSSRAFKNRDLVAIKNSIACHCNMVASVNTTDIMLSIGDPLGVLTHERSKSSQRQLIKETHEADSRFYAVRACDTNGKKEVSRTYLRLPRHEILLNLLACMCRLLGCDVQVGSTKDTLIVICIDVAVSC